MTFNNSKQQLNTVAIGQSRSFADARGTTPSLPGSPKSKKRHPLHITLLVILPIVLLYSLVEVASAAYRGNSQLSIHIGSQQSGLIDLNQSLPISPYLLGTNVFPQVGSDSLDEPASGFMSYAPSIVNGLRSSHIRLLRFPGGEWGELHQLSPVQLNDFSKLLTQTGADGIVQVSLSDPPGQTLTLAARASNAGLLVDYMNNRHSIQRTGNLAQAPFHPVKFWTVGNEPDRLTNPDTGLKYTVSQYTQAFIQFSIAMHQIDPTIQVFGPEISQYGGPAKDPTDAQGKHWMEDFLQGISTYERLHPNPHFHLLDGISFHRYPFDNASMLSTALLQSSNEWDTSIPSLRQQIRQDFGRDIPVAVTEVNTNPNNQVPQPRFASLWWADTLGRLMSQQTEFVAFFSAEGVDTPYPLFSSHGLQASPMLRTMQLFALLQHNFIPVQMSHEPVGLYATQDSTHQTVSLLFVNKSSSIQQVNISPESGILPFTPWHSLDLTLQGYSIVVVTLHRNGGAETDSFFTNSDKTNVPALVHTVLQ
ncbi:MAG: hypothetical protein JO215_15835 [Ktedonobacteraceae bacterium]|nr:hypothetical protein [Ktedonobacteraceae bacterium]